MFRGMGDTNRRCSLTREMAMSWYGVAISLVRKGQCSLASVTELCGLVPERDPGQLLFGCCPGSLPGGGGLGVDEVARVPP